MITGTYVATVVAALLILFAAIEYANWIQWDEQRRQQRRVHRNLMRMGGRR